MPCSTCYNTAACHSTVTLQIPMDATIQAIIHAILQLDAMILHAYALLAFTILALIATSMLNCSACVTESKDGCYSTADVLHVL